MRYILLTMAGVLAATAFSMSVSQSRDAAEPPVVVTPAVHPAPSSHSRARAHLSIDTTFVANWTFDDGMGGPDPQGWTSVDLSAQADTFFHVDDFAGLPPNVWQPLQGSRSLWCGARPCQPVDVCGYASLPGYGNNWDQEFQSVEFNVAGDVTIDFLARVDSEPGYDYTFLEYSSGGSAWQELADFGFSSPAQLHSETIPAAAHSGSLKIRFHFVSDYTVSDEDGLYNFNGAFVLDSLAVRDASGVVDYQDFEDEAVGAHATTDGNWQAGDFPAFGDFAGLFDGGSVLQEDTLTTNQSHLWGFFNGSPDTYACGGHPEQAAVPYSMTFYGKELFLHNMVYSPAIDLAGLPPGDVLILQLDAYLDLPLDNAVYMEVFVRSLVDGTWSGWWRSGPYQASDVKRWYTITRNVSQNIPGDATSVQVAVGAEDRCELMCPGSASGDCHTHAPLIDNVRLFSIPEIITVTNTNSYGPGSFMDALGAVSVTPTPGVILFDIPGPGPHTLPGPSHEFFIGAPVIVDGTSQPGYAGTPLIRITSSTDVPFKVIKPSTFLGIEFYRAPSQGTTLAMVIHDPVVIQGCAFVNWSTSLWISADDCVIGGVQPGEGNTFTGFWERAIQVAGVRNSIRGNSIYHAGTPDGFGIDLDATGVNPNDPLDADTGANNRQNFPVLTGHNPVNGAVLGQMSSAPSTTYTLDFYLSPACDATGYGDGKTYLGSGQVTTGPSGTAGFATVLGTLPGGGVITATATDPDGNTSEFSACISARNTPVGHNVVVQPVDETTGTTPVTVTFDQVTSLGYTGLTTSPTGPALPGSFLAGDGVYYYLSTSAGFTGNVEICINYEEGSLSVPESALRMLSWESDAWGDILVSLDIDNDMVCGISDHLSPFVIGAGSVTGIGDDTPRAPALHPNVPNPFNPATTVRFDVPAGGAHVAIRVYDVSGRLVRTLVDERRPAGTHTVTWDGRNNAGHAVSSGVYFCRMEAGTFAEARRMVLLK